MSNNILQSKTFAEEGNFLISEEIANERTKIIKLINECNEGETKTKIESITKLQEIILHTTNSVELLDEFIDDILGFVVQQNANQEIKRCVTGFIEEVCKSQIQFLPRVTTILSMLLRDDSPQVQKRIIQASVSIYKKSLQWLSATTTEITDSVEQAWNTLCLIKAQILDMIDHDNDGIRTNAIKFLEGVVILQTHRDEDSMKRDNDFSLEDVPMTLKIARRRKLEDEAIQIFDLLLKFHAASHISSVNLIACTGTLCTISKLRPSLMNPVIEALKKLHSNLPPTLTDSQVSSVRKHLKMQFLNILKHPASYEMHSIIIEILVDLGSSHQEIGRAIPKMDRTEKERRNKRALEHAATSSAAKKAKLDKNVQIQEKQKTQEVLSVVARPMEIDIEELAEQKLKANKLNEFFVMENLKTAEQVVQIVMAAMVNLPNDCPAHFLTSYLPINNLTIPHQTKKIAELLGEQMTDKKVGPGISAITKDPPMKLKVSLEEEKIIIQSMRKEIVPVEPIVEEKDDEMDEKLEKDEKEEATKKLRETLERVKGEQIIPKMKQRVKTLKLQEITKPLSKIIKEKFLTDAIIRILKSERQCIVGGVALKRKKILTVMAATFTPTVKEVILKFILDDLKNRIDLGFSWLYEEYSLYQGFTRNSFIKSEHKPDYAYNKLLSALILKVLENPNILEKRKLIRRIYLEAPILSDESIEKLHEMCSISELLDCSMELIKDILIRRPPKQEKCLTMLLKYSVHETIEIRDKSIENIINLYAVDKILMDKIEEFANLWLNFLVKDTPPQIIFSPELGRTDVIATWNDQLTKTCISLFLALMPYREDFIHNLSQVYVSASADMKRAILPTVETPIRKMGQDSFEILRLIELCPKGSEALITRIIYNLTDKVNPTPNLVTKVKELYNKKVFDVRLLIPILSGLTKSEILTALPKLIKCNPPIVREVFNKLLGFGNEFKNISMSVSPSEILVNLHTLNPKVHDLITIVKATSLCLEKKDVFTHEVLGVVLQQLVEMTPPPILLMRTVLQSLALYPRLAPFVTNLLQRLILKQVWKQKVVWDGFLKCCQKLQPQSLPVLLQLPNPQLLEGLTACPDLRAPLLEYALTITDNQVGHIGKATMDILMGRESVAIKKIVDDDASVTIKKELIEEATTEKVNQPLPPGEE